MSSVAEGAAAPHEQPLGLARLADAVDSVYFLLANNLEEELESNRWHYARRWARHLPVTLLQPSDDVLRNPEAKPVPTIPNCEFLSITSPNPEATYPLGGLVQAGQLMQHMRERGHDKPLLWSYNPQLAGLCAAVFRRRGASTTPPRTTSTSSTCPTSSTASSRPRCSSATW